MVKRQKDDRANCSDARAIDAVAVEPGHPVPPKGSVILRTRARSIPNSSDSSTGETAQTATSPPEKNSESARLPGRGVGASIRRSWIAAWRAVPVQSLRSINSRSDLRPRERPERMVPTGTSRIVAASSYEVPSRPIRRVIRR